MKRIITIVLLLIIQTATTTRKAQAQIPIVDVIKGAVKKVIKAIDLKIQRQQNKVIWLQNAQKELENALSKLKLGEIANWTGKQKELYQKYFDELQQVKSIIAYYQRIREITDKQVRIVQDYNRAWALLTRDPHLSTRELHYMSSVYSGMLQATVKDIDELSLVINSFKTQMTDAKRLEIIGKVGAHVDQTHADLQRFNLQNQILSLHRSGSEQEIDRVKKMYGLQ